MAYINVKTPGEKKEIEKILAYTQPRCPGCGGVMRFSIYPDNGSYIGHYFCTECGVWQTQSNMGKGAVAVALKCYNDAMKRK